MKYTLIDNYINIYNKTQYNNMEATQTSTHKYFITYQNEPHYQDFDKAKRNICMTYTINEDGTVSYGAAIFRKQSKQEKCVKRSIRETAIKRLQKKPVTIQVKHDGVLNPKSETDMLLIKDAVRKAMFTKGCKQKVQTVSA